MAIKSQILLSDSDVKLIELISTIYNVMLLAFYRAIDQSKTIFNLVNGFMDEYEDESGVDTVNSSNESYNSTDDYYEPISDSYTKLILHLNNNVTDGAGKTVTNNNVTFSDSIYKFGTHSAYFNGSDAYLSLADSDDWDFGTGDFTIDCWVYLTDNSDYYTIIDNGGYDVGVRILWSEANGYFNIRIVNNVQTFNASLSLNTWYHIALVRTGTTVRLFVNGTQVGSDWSNNSDIIGLTRGLFVGGDTVSTTHKFPGYMDEYRVSKGIARWTTSFTPPSSEYFVGTENMTLLSNAQVAESVPTSARLVLFEEDVDTITLNTDLKAYVSRDNGTTYSQVTLVNEGYYTTSKNILAGLVDISGQPSGTNMKYKVETLNAKNLKLHGTGVNWA